MKKKLPYGTSDYGQVIIKNRYYVDKTKYIVALENEINPYHFFIRPRKFGKSLFISTLNYYYDINRAYQFDLLFKDTYVEKHPTPEHRVKGFLTCHFISLTLLPFTLSKRLFYRANTFSAEQTPLLTRVYFLRCSS